MFAWYEATRYLLGRYGEHVGATPPEEAPIKSPLPAGEG